MKVAVLLILVVCRYVFAKATYTTDKNHMHYHSLHEGRQQPLSHKETTATFWQDIAHATLKERLQQTLNKKTAKNVILFLGDGMSLATTAAARTHLGQRNNKNGEETFLSFEKFPFTGLSKTYCVDQQVAESACTATAYLCGIKANEATIGVTAAVKLNDCEGMINEDNHVRSLARLAQLAGKRSGIVTTTRITHASPAGAYAHIANRDWESDTDVENDNYNPIKCRDIAYQLIYEETGKNLNVIFGGGRKHFLPNDVSDDEGKRGFRSDNRDLIIEWEKLHNSTNHKYIYNLKGLQDLASDTEHVLGLFDSDHMDYNLDRDEKNKPSLLEMTKKAVELLSAGDNGYFLFVEGGRIDHAHHETWARKALDETIEFHKAVEAALNMTNEEDTLIVVTSDHSHTMTLNGYPYRGQDIFGIAGMGDDNLPYTTLSYANGPSGLNGFRPNITNHDFADKNYKYPSLTLLDSETHGGEDVSIYANGPWAHLFTGVIEQNAIPHMISYASCLGNFVDGEVRSDSKTITNMLMITMLSVICTIFCIYV